MGRGEPHIYHLFIGGKKLPASVPSWWIPTGLIKEPIPTIYSSNNMYLHKRLQIKRLLGFTWTIRHVVFLLFHRQTQGLLDSRHRWVRTQKTVPVGSRPSRNEANCVCTLAITPPFYTPKSEKCQEWSETSARTKLTVITKTQHDGKLFFFGGTHVMCGLKFGFVHLLTWLWPILEASTGGW